MIGYWFCGDKLRDGRPIPADGEWLVHEGPLEPCVSGLHASEHPFDAMQYAPGATLCKVELEGDLIPHGDPVDKWVGRRRRIIARIDATTLLRRFAADQALSVAHLWEMPAVVREYLTSLDEDKRAAAWAAAESARASAAESAESAWASAESARAAAESAWAAAESAARAAARAAQINYLITLIEREEA